MNTYFLEVFSEISESLGALAYTAKTKKSPRRTGIHVSVDNKNWRQNEKRGIHVKLVKDLLDVVDGAQVFSNVPTSRGAFGQMPFPLSEI